MKISLSIPFEFTITNHGYGVISEQVVHALQALGHSVPYRDRTAPVEICIGQPYLWQWSSKNSYKIGYVAWESTKIPDIWRPKLRSCDELWVTSEFVKQALEGEGFPVTQVYEHGIDQNLWKPRPRVRQPGEAIRFLHMGEPAPRKGGQLTFDTFREVWGNSKDAKLTIKSHGLSTIRGKNNAHPDRELKNVTIIPDEYPVYQLVDLMKRHDVLVYPSYGEGFGLIPLQAMSMGMPVICTAAWAPYKSFILPELRLGSSLDTSPWRGHPGDVYHPDKTDLRQAMQLAGENFNEYSQRAYDLSKFVAKRFDWIKLTEKAFEHLVNKFDSKENSAKMLV